MYIFINYCVYSLASEVVKVRIKRLNPSRHHPRSLTAASRPDGPQMGLEAKKEMCFAILVSPLRNAITSLHSWQKKLAVSEWKWEYFVQSSQDEREREATQREGERERDTGE